MHAVLISAWLDIHLVGIKCIFGKGSVRGLLVEKELGNSTRVYLFKQRDDFYHLFIC
jgi:hypothetical protein